MVLKPKRVLKRFINRGGIFVACTLYAGLSFEQVVKEYNQTVVSVCIMRLKNWADAEDCFQNTFLKLYHKSPKIDSREYLKAWLIRVAINECTSYIRKNKHTVSLDDHKDQMMDFPHDDTDISWALLKLENKYRDVLYLHYVEQYKVHEIAQIIGKNPNTVKTLLMRGREKLKSIYGGDCCE